MGQFLKKDLFIDLAASHLSCPATRGILVSQPEIEPVPLAFEALDPCILTTGSPGKSP